MPDLVTTPTENPEDYDLMIAAAEKTLGISGEYTAEDVLQTFGVDHEVMKENNDFSKLDEKIVAKNNLIRHLIMGQMKDRRYFTIESPYENSCIKCRGTGEIYKFHRRKVDVNCHICGNSGKIRKGPTEPCGSCKGSGRYKRRWKGGGGINVTCRRCDGKGVVPSKTVKCQECQGTGKKAKNVPDHNIRSTTPCKVCGQLGFTENGPPEPQKRPPKHVNPPRKGDRSLSNPVMTAGLAGKIRDALPTHKS